jgi:hypothetical protein
MKKQIIILAITALITGGCGGRTSKKQTENNTVVKEETVHIIGIDSDEPEKIIEYDTEIPILKNVNTIKIDHAYCKTKKGVKQIFHSDSEYSKYRITELNDGEAGNRFVYDDMSISFSIIAKVELYENIHSLIIRGYWEDLTRIWLVNYDKNSTEADFYAYIDSYLIGYCYDDIGEGWITSVVYVQPKPYIERTTDSWGNVEKNKIEILNSGKFNVTQTVHSKYEM